MKQLMFKLTELRLCIKYWTSIPKGVRRNLIELAIALGEMTTVRGKDIEQECVNKVTDIAVSRAEYIENYIKFLKGGTDA